MRNRQSILDTSTSGERSQTLRGSVLSVSPNVLPVTLGCVSDKLPSDTEVLFTRLRLDIGASSDLQPTAVLRTASRVVPHRTSVLLLTTQSHLAPYLLDRNGSPYK